MNPHEVAGHIIAGIWIAAYIFGLLITTVIAGRLITSLTVTLTHPYSLSYTGGFLAYYISHPFELYAPTNPIPHPTIYPPLVPLLFPDLPGISVYQSSRALNWLAILACSGLLYYLGREHTGRHGPGLAAGALYLLSPSVTNATVLLRVDHVAMALLLATVAVFVAGRSLWVVGALAVAAGFAKQPYAILAIAPVMLALWTRGQRRRSLWFGVATASAGLLLLGLLSLATNGWAIRHLLVYNAAVPWFESVFVSQTYTLLFTHGLLIGIAWGAVLSLSRRDWRSPVPWLFVIGLALGLATVGKEGAWIGYFYPAIASGAILAASTVTSYDVKNRLPTGQQAASALIILLVVGQLGLYTQWQPQPQKSLGSQAELADRLGNVDEPVIAEDPSVAPGHGPPVDVLMVQALVEAQVVDGDPVARALRCGRWVYVVTWITADPKKAGLSRWTEAQVRAIEQHYEPVKYSRSWSVYRYNGTATCRPV